MQGQRMRDQDSSSCPSPTVLDNTPAELTDNESEDRNRAGGIPLALASPRSGPLPQRRRRRRRRDIFHLHSRHSFHAGVAPVRMRGRVRPSLHRVLDALFSGTDNSEDIGSPRVTDQLTASNLLVQNSLAAQIIPENTAITSSSDWGNGSATQVSYGSLELIGPAAFLFSSPTLENYAGEASESRTSSILTRSHSSLYRRGSLAGSISGISRSSSFSNATTEETLDDLVLEPFQHVELTRSVSDVLLNERSREHDEEAATTDACTARNRVGLTQSFMIADDIYQSPSFRKLAPSILRRIFSYLGKEDYANIRRVCQDWTHALDSIQPIPRSRIQTMPTEMIHHVYNYLSPVEFNAARHTCRNWMLASLEMGILTRMLKRGGWWSGAGNDIRSQADSESTTSKEWSASTCLARECMLGPAYTADGMTKISGNKEPSPIALSGIVDFTCLLVSDVKQKEILTFNVSVCGKYALVARGRVICVYKLSGKDIEPLTSIICPHKVLATSMDSSSGRFAVAALLSSRMGLVCDLQFARNADDADSDTSDGSASNSSTEALHGEVPSSLVRHLTIIEQASTMNGDVFASNPGVPIGYAPSFDAINIHNAGGDFTLLSAEPNQDRNWLNRTWNHKRRGPRTVDAPNPKVKFQSSSSPSANSSAQTLHIETGPRNIYRHLCSDDDPPRSVAICPQRRCVAFGCSSGIELHWVDAITGQDMNRWFPLTAPSDILYFLPPRRSMDNSRKLRLISSAIHPSERPALCERFFASRPSLSTFWGAFAMDNRIGPHRDSIANYDHYRAVPLSDGFHILFTEPTTNTLCLGSDAPLGGPNKLLRKVLFTSPVPGCVPRVYRAAQDLRYGARVVVAFGERIMLYCVPPDLLLASQKEHMAAEVGNSENHEREEDHEQDWLEWWPEAENTIYVKLPYGSHPLWPLNLQGLCIGRMEGIVDLAVNVSPRLTIWGFGKDGVANVWSIAGAHPPETISRKRIGRNGLLAETFELDLDGDVVMLNADQPGPSKTA